MLVNRHKLNVQHHGSGNGPVVALLHHGLGSVKAWRELIPALVGAGYQVIAYDRWGYGSSDPRQALDLPTFATDVEDLHLILAGYDVKRAVLVGHSDGGTIALYFAAQYPGLVSCIVAVAAHIYVEPRMGPGILGVKHAFENDPHFRQGLQHAHGDKYESTFHNWFGGWQRMELLNWDMRPLLLQIRCPVLVVQGELDEHATPQHAKDIAAAIPGAELWLVEGAGHMFPQEDAAMFNPKILEFLKEHSSDEQ